MRLFCTARLQRPGASAPLCRLVTPLTNENFNKHTCSYKALKS